MVEEEVRTQGMTTEQEEGVEIIRQAMKAWELVDTHIYNKSSSCTGGTMTRTKKTAEATMTVATVNVRSLNDAKLELALQYFVAEEWDVLFLINTQLNRKGGDYMVKKIKRRLGTGTRTHTCPCIMDSGADTGTGFRRA